MIELNGTTIQTLDEHPMTELPAGGHLMTVVVSVEPNNPGTPAHRHPGPVYGYVLEGEMIVELEGDAPVLKRAGDTIWSRAATASTTRRPIPGTPSSASSCSWPARTEKTC
ncbi:cupin domain-containing protein [Pseudonocardia sp. HH130630-07]|uniref:cupin domain-containing protein n=1 Tax=Pseudonocardia sp. HH130630-07 TaxID=1690815 RepID=UPI000A55FCD4|nr:cupin domain-containing protein [Pseudonocardia sp. HH130630-07]